MVLGHESDGIPDEALPLLDIIVEIPMVGTGLSLNVAVAGSLVLYRDRSAAASVDGRAVGRSPDRAVRSPGRRRRIEELGCCGQWLCQVSGCAPDGQLSARPAELRWRRENGEAGPALSERHPPAQISNGWSTG